MNTNSSAKMPSTSTQTKLNLQDNFLNQARKESIPVIIHLVNGVPVKGIVKGFDNFTIIIENEGKQLLVYKHALSTVSPLRPLPRINKDK
ncbi:MAG: Protein hfq [Firmicutes bacterium]|nr:Protein hfq [Bacillota bacterium]